MQPDPSGPEDEIAGRASGARYDQAAGGESRAFDDEDENDLDEELPDQQSSDALHARMFGLASRNGRSHAAFLADQLAGYTHWYWKSGEAYQRLTTLVQVSAALSGLLATILAAAPEGVRPERSEESWRWAIAILSALTTVLTGALPSLTRAARDREEGLIQMTRLRQELDILKGQPTPSLDTYLAALVVTERIANTERRFGIGGGGRTDATTAP